MEDFPFSDKLGKKTEPQVDWNFQPLLPSKQFSENLPPKNLQPPKIDLHELNWKLPIKADDDDLKKQIFENVNSKKSSESKPDLEKAALKEKVLAELSGEDLRKVDLMRLQLSVSNAEERSRRQAELKTFLQDKLKERSNDAGLEQVLNPPSSSDLYKEIKSLRAEEAKELIKESRAKLLGDARTAIKEAGKFQEFEKKLQVFEQRAQNRGLAESELLSTYLQIGRVLDPDLKLAHGDKSNLARAMMANVADPTSIDQGGHNTCNVTAFQVRLTSQEPALASKVVADVAVNGVFSAADGTVVRPLNLDPDGEASQDPTFDGSRNYASQLFQLTAINSYWNRRETLPGGKTIGKGNIQYAQGPHGEYLLDMTVNPPQKQRFDTIDAGHPWLDIHGVSEIAEQLTGKPSENFGIKRWVYSSESEGVFKVLTLGAFKEKLQYLKDKNAFPVLLEVDADKKPFGDGKGFGPHVVTITDYDPEKGLVSIDNQWGKGADMTGLPGQKEKVPVDLIFSAMSPVPSFDFLWDKAKNGLSQVKTKDAVTPTIAALSVKGLKWGTSAAAPVAIRSGLGSLSELGVPGAAKLLSASETRLGSAALRGGSSLLALGAFAYMNDLPGAFKEGNSRGAGKLARVAGDWASFEIGRGIVSKTVSLVPWAPARIGLSLAGGAATGAVFDKLLGEGSEIGGSWVYDRVHDYIYTQRPVKAPEAPKVPAPVREALGAPNPDLQFGKAKLGEILESRIKNRENPLNRPGIAVGPPLRQ